MNPVIEILRTQLPIEEESDAFGEDAIQIFHTPGVSTADALHDLRPTGPGPCGTHGLRYWDHGFYLADPLAWEFPTVWRAGPESQTDDQEPIWG